MSVLYLEKDVFQQLTEADIRYIIDEHMQNTRYEKLWNYYIGNHKILYETKKDSTAPNNQIVNNVCRYVTDCYTGYFAGEPVSYTSSSDNQEYLEALMNVFDYNDEQDENAELSKKVSIFGECYEMLYLDEDANIRFTNITPDCIIMIKSTSGDYLGTIRFIRSETLRHERILKVEFWTSDNCWYFKSINGGNLDLIDIRDHAWGDVPFVEYLNNEERKGDFEDIIKLNDAYNRAQSNTANMFQYNDEALMLISKLGSVTSQDIVDMKEKGAVILDEGGTVSWLLKQIDDAALENHKNRLKEDMHTYSFVPNMSDDNFGNNLSGISISYKLWTMEQETAIKERKMKKGLQRRIELITGILNKFFHQYDYRDIQPKFKRNKPLNLSEIVDVVNKLDGKLSDQTLISWLPNIDDVNAEIEKRDAQYQEKDEKMGVYTNLAKAFSDQLKEPEHETANEI